MTAASACGTRSRPASAITPRRRRSTATRAARSSFTASSDALAITQEAVAIVFAPGAALPGQIRDDSHRAVREHGQACPAHPLRGNYLDGAASLNEHRAGRALHAAPAGLHFNDKLAIVATPDFMPLVEQRVALEARNAFSLTERERLPLLSVGRRRADGTSETGTSRGRIPVSARRPHPWPRRRRCRPISRQPVGACHLLRGRARCARRRRPRLHDMRDASLSVDGASGYDVVLLTTRLRDGRKALELDGLHRRRREPRRRRSLRDAALASAARDRLYAIRAPAR